MVTSTRENRSRTPFGPPCALGRAPENQPRFPSSHCDEYSRLPNLVTMRPRSSDLVFRDTSFSLSLSFCLFYIPVGGSRVTFRFPTFEVLCCSFLVTSLDHTYLPACTGLGFPSSHCDEYSRLPNLVTVRPRSSDPSPVHAGR